MKAIWINWMIRNIKMVIMDIEMVMNTKKVIRNIKMVIMDIEKVTNIKEVTMNIKMVKNT